MARIGNQKSSIENQTAWLSLDERDNDAFTFILEHLPPHMHLVIATREDPNLPLARLRARGHLTELRVADLRFTPAETAEFLNQVMGLNLPPKEIATLENRIEGWTTGLQLAAISMQGKEDPASFIKTFSRSHYFVLDYLVMVGRPKKHELNRRS